MKKLITIALIYIALAPLGTPLFAQSETDQPVKCSAGFLETSASTDLCVWSDMNTKLYVIHPKGGSSSSDEPVLYLLGGPGSKGNVHLNHMALIANRLGRTVLLPDPADSAPELECSQTDMDDAQRGIASTADAAIFYTRSLQQTRLDGCLEQIKVSPALQGAISTKQQAARLMELREALGVKAWVIFAESYGGRLALATSAVDEAGISALILDSPETPWVSSFWHTGQNFKQALSILSELCRDQYRCPAKRLHLERRLPQIISVFEREDVEPLELKDFYTRQVVAYARPTQEQLFITTFMALRSSSRAELMPYIAAAPNDEGLKKRFGLLLSELLRPGSSLNMGFHHIVRCSELPLETWYSALNADKAELPELTPFLDYLEWRQKYVCHALNIEAPAQVKHYAPATVKTLVLSGGLDPVTPSSVISVAFPQNANFSSIQYETLGHVVHTQLDCVMDDVAQFLDSSDPTLQPFQSACSKKELKMRFYSPVVRR